MKKLFPIFALVILLSSLLLHSAFADETEEKKSSLESQIAEYEAKLAEIRSEKNTLSSQISYMDTQIYITELRVKETEESIVQTEDQINKLGDRIEGLDESLDRLSKSLVEQIVAGYKNRQLSLFDIILGSNNSSTLANRLKYFSVARDSNQKALLQVQEAKNNYEEQKVIREKKVEELDVLSIQLEAQQNDLAFQKEAKKNLLSITQNDEQIYQQKLAQAQAEYAAIQKIISGSGNETKVGSVTKGDRIASVLVGRSCNSSGTHLHFIVSENGSEKNPFGYLKPVDFENESEGDAFNPSGSWDWPLDPTIHLHQGYGSTWFVRTYGWYSFHNGIDITGSSNTVKAVADGELFHGSYTGFNGCALPYVRLKHKDSGFSTFYLHVGY